MPQKKPTSVVVIAVLQLVFGVLFLIGAVAALAGLGDWLAALNQQNQAAQRPDRPEARAVGGGGPKRQENQAAQQQPFDQKQINDKLAEKLPHFDAVQKGQAGVSALLCLLMIVGAVGLLGLKPWGRLLTIVYAVLSILYALASAVYNFVFIVPAFQAIGQEMAQQMSQMGGPQAQQAPIIAPVMQGFGIGIASCGLLVIIYPIIVLLIMRRPAVRAAFRGEPWPPEREDVLDRNVAEDLPEPGEG